MSAIEEQRLHEGGVLEMKRRLPVIELKDCGDGSCGCGCGDFVPDSYFQQKRKAKDEQNSGPTPAT